MAEAERCDWCGRRFDRPGFYDRCKALHPEPTLAQKIAEAVEDEIHGRKGIGWRMCDAEVIDGIRDGLVKAIEPLLPPP